MTIDELLHQLEPLTHKDRAKRMIELGHRAGASVTDPEAINIREVLRKMETGDFYQRYLALQSCQGSRNGEHVLRAFSDPSRMIRGLSISLVPLMCSDPQVLAALAQSDIPAASKLCRGLRRQARQAVIDTFLKELANKSETEANRHFLKLLAFGSTALVAVYLHRLRERSEAYHWSRLAKRHPEPTAKALIQEAAGLERPDYRLLLNANGALPHLAERKPDLALELARALLKQFSLGQLELDRLLTRRPEEVAELVLASPDRTHFNFDPVAGRLTTARLTGLLTNHPQALGRRVNWLKKLRPATRRAVYVALNSGWRQSDGKIAPTLLDWLPQDLRESEGHRHLALPALAGSPELRLLYAGYLPWEEARTILDPYMGDPEPALRAVAHTALAKVVFYYREHLPALLDIVRARRNEQDPVRLAMLTGLANIPPGSWQEDHLEKLGLIVRDALNAADLSMLTTSQIERLIIKVLPRHTAWSAGWLAVLVRERGRISFYDLASRLSDRDVKAIKGPLLPVFQSWSRREREEHLVAAAESLGRRLRVFDELVTVLVNVLKDTRKVWHARGILDLFAQHRRDILFQLLPELLEEDPSWITLPEVYQTLHRWRQNLITPYLGQQAYQGRFSTGKTRFLLPLYSGFHRWTPSQQAIFARTLSEVAGDDMRDSPAIISAIRQLEALPGVPPTRLLELAGDKREAVRDTAIRALARLDAGEGIPALLEMMNDERARIAIYALRQAILAMPSERALSVLTTLPMNKVTVAKEVVRLLGEIRNEGAYRELLRMAGESGLHRDIRVALLRGLWEYLERDETWPILEEAARNPDPAIARTVGRIGANGLSAKAQNRLVWLLTVLLDHPEARVRIEVLGRCSQLPVNDREQLLLPRLLSALQSHLPLEYTLAASAITATYTGQEATLVGQAVAGIITRRKVLQTLVDYLASAAKQRKEQLLPTVRSVLAALEADALTATLRIKLALFVLSWDELVGMLTEMVNRGELHEEALISAARLLEATEDRVDVSGMPVLEEALAKSPEAKLRRLALAALLGQANSSLGWDVARLERLEQYRIDPSPLVRAAAQFTFPPAEE
ncbi:MAG TPA: HEAT repeat domain-containing protein [Chloroflexia bacterium]|nr:HEAT repeat domain-containing protein [Chloroflexia bacterium]